jgi:hypothetical protein
MMISALAAVGACHASLRLAANYILNLVVENINIGSENSKMFTCMTCTVLLLPIERLGLVVHGAYPKNGRDLAL